MKDLDKIIQNPKKYAEEISLKKLVSVLEKLSKQYYNTGESLVTDDVYDIMIDVLRKRDPDNEFLFTVGAKPEAKCAVDLPFNMFSLNKIKSGEKSLIKWFEKYNGPFIVSDKLDGVSAQLYKNNEGVVNLYTRGNATTGRNISHLIPYLIPPTVIKRTPNDTSIRGEIIISKKEFEKLVDVYKNPRNMVAGIVNSNKLDSRVAAKLQFVTYNIIHPNYLYNEQLKLLKQWKYKVVWHAIFAVMVGEEDYITAIQNELEYLLQERRNESEFDVDGIVIHDDSQIYSCATENPPYAMAFKANVLYKDAEVEEVIWEPTMYGYLQPIVKIVPIKLQGTTITFVTGRHGKYIFDNKIGKGSIVRITRSGDVIPYILDVIKPNQQADMPKIKYAWSDTGVDAIVVDPDVATQRTIEIKKNIYFFKTIGVKNLSRGNLTKLYSEGHKTVLDIVEACVKQDMESLGPNLAQKICASINTALAKVKMHELMAASLKFGRGMGPKKIKELLNAHPQILEYNKKMTKTEIIDTIKDVEGFADTSADKIVEGLNEFNDFFDKLVKVSKIKIKNKKKKTEGKIFLGQIFVLTDFHDKKLIKDFIEDNGGKVTTSVSKKTSVIICGDKNGDSIKLKTGKKLGIKILTKEEFVEEYIKI